MVRELRNLYIDICILNDELSKIISGLSSVQELENILEDDKDLQLLKNKIVGKIKSKQYERNQLEESFKSIMLGTYRLKVSFKGGEILCGNDNIRDSVLERYEKTLHEYIELFSTEGIESKNAVEDLSNIFSQMKSFCQMLEELLQHLIWIRKEDSDCFDGLSLSLISEKIRAYDAVMASYQEFIKLLSEEETRTFSNLNAKYIFKNTSLMPLVFANNTHPLIGQKNSLKRLFLCQFHVERTPSMRVSLDKNFYNCFGCGKNGNVVDYLSQIHGISSVEVLYLLAEIFMMYIPDNPFRLGDRYNVVLKYRSVLLSDEYRKFLTESMDGVCKKSPQYKSVYMTLLAQIDRIKAGVWDEDFCFEPKQKGYIFMDLYLVRGEELTKKLIPSSDDILPF